MNPGESALSSVCPNSWRLPSGGPGGDFTALYNEYKMSITDPTGPNFISSGYYDRSSVLSQDYEGFFWSSTASDKLEYAYFLRLYTNHVGSQDAYAKNRGYSVRCIARE